MKLINKKNKNYTQVFQLFTEEEWTKTSKNFNKNISNFFTGKKYEVFVNAHEEGITYFIGLGKSALQNFEIQQVAAKFSQTQKEKLLAVPTLALADFLNEKQFEEFVKGLLTGTYNYPFDKKHAFWNTKFELHFENLSQKKLDHISQKAEALVNGQTACQDWLNKPANLKKPDILSAYLKNLAKKYDLKYTAFNRKKCEELGLGAYLSVNQGSAYDAAFTILEYKTTAKNAKTFGLVGKCILFDTGGISIKSSANLHYMKSDMGGATAVLGTLIYAAEMQLPVNIVAVLPITDNAVSEKALLPSDVITAYNGKTIEVLDTDAEGRLILADGLSYLSKNYKTDFLIDLATLTGSSVRMFGDTCAAMFSNNEELKNNLIKTGDQTNQRVWNLPLWDVWKDDIQSDVADIKNISLKPVGDCIIAAKFLEQFIENHPKWAHLDIAGVAFGSVGYAKEKAATGFGVQLLVNLIENYH
ncbi:MULTISPECIES: leucyl aminopeptidase family protein [Chryseobacterium]|uniref:M17 family metallopeptidase n=1 Tax=Chryseobacterium TaxID=59732 RepID=UPI000787FE5A|nr:MULTISPECIES: leucyl aminopeptidase family protein [Chryseobacterium]KYH05116.1 peptidase M17 [Chryseobacterium cucumeris]RKE81852.1 leucyl aminopeptidase [Chryseobacterium sp. AG363]WFB68752.1 leucyl aminopeptidase family protein [Chryseobacterium sp. WX]WNI37810.1 leucyl aminopeptidase family protein [Chryseobacterium sp. SG20098]